MASLKNFFETLSLKKVSVLFCLIGFLVYGNTLHNPFIWDDYSLIVDNAFVKDWHYFPQYFTQNLFAGAGQYDGYWRPLQLLSYAIDYHIAGLNVVLYHVENILWHIAATILVFVVILKIFSNKAAAFITALVFLIHPLQIEAVTYIAGRSDSMPAVFLLLSFLFFLKYANEAKRGRTLALSLFFFAISFFIHERTLIFPAIIALYLFTLYRGTLLKTTREKTTLILWYFSLSAAYFLFRLMALQFTLDLPTIGNAPFFTTLFNNMEMFFRLIAFFFGLLIYPKTLALTHEFAAPLSVFDISVISGFIITALSFVATFFSLRGKKEIAFGVLWFWILFSLSAYTYFKIGFALEHWFYLPIIGLALPLSLAITRKLSATHSKNIRAFSIIALVTIFAVLSFRTVTRNEDWADPISFYKKGISAGAHATKSYENLGVEYLRLGRIDEAMAILKKASEAKDAEFSTWLNMGVVYAETGNDDLAEKNFLIALGKNPLVLEAYDGLLTIYVTQEKFDEAFSIANQGVSYFPNDPTLLANLGSLYVQRGDQKDALLILRKALSLDPKNEDIKEFISEIESQTK